MHHYLEKIIDYKRQELEQQRRKIPLQDVRKMARDAEPTRNFLESVSGPASHIIAEVKKASPSAGVIRDDFDPVAIAQVYEENGASCLSVLTDEHFFQGHLAYLKRIHDVVRLPLLRKDFTLSDYHLYEARAHGADAVLLIVRILEENQIRDYIALAQELGLTSLVEVHDEQEMSIASKVGATLIGINNRDLQTFKVSLDTSITLSQQAPKGAVLVSESGISKREDIQKLETAGIHNFLIGEALLREKDFGEKLRELLGS